MPKELRFVTQPTDVLAERVMAPVEVELVDGDGNRFPASNRLVTLSIDESPSGSIGTLGGTVTVSSVDGLATFSDLSIEQLGSYALVASSPGVYEATSEGFRNYVTFTAISAGFKHSCALTEEGRVYCWGNYGHGELGTGLGFPDHPVPHRVVGDVTFASVSAGGYQTCGMTMDGEAYCWGWNTDGAVGDGTQTERDTPVPISVGLPLLGIDAGFDHTCAVTVANTAYCWGSNSTGQLGDGSTDPSTIPVLVAGGLTVTSVDAGWQHTCGVTVDEDIYCWGAGTLGDGSSTTSPVPVQVTLPSGVDGFRSVSVGSGGVTHSCARTAPSDEVFCWGYNLAGQLGDGTMSQRNVPTGLAGATVSFASVSAGDYHTCAITSAGEAFCWGRDDEGQVGDSGPADHSLPTPVSGGHVFVSIDGGETHSCGVTTDGEAWCWGANGEGQLGDGTHDFRSVPVRAVQ